MKISKKQTLAGTAAPLTLFPEAFPASPTVMPANDSARPTSAICGPKCLEEFAKFNRATLWAKTLAALLIGQGDWFSTRSRLIWRLKGTKSSRFYFQLQVKTLPTSGTVSGLLPTPTVQDSFKASKRFRDDFQNNLTAYVFNGLIPTPTAKIWKGSRSKQKLEEIGRTEANGLPEYLEMNGATGQLNPQFVLEMMGFPPDWTLLPFLSQPGEEKA